MAKKRNNYNYERMLFLISFFELFNCAFFQRINGWQRETEREKERERERERECVKLSSGGEESELKSIVAPSLRKKSISVSLRSKIFSQIPRMLV